MQRVYAGKSAIHGRGLFTKRGAHRGERICCVKGKKKIMQNKSKKDALANPDWIGVSKRTWIDPAVPFKYLNHSCEPNTGIKGRVSMHALRDIQPDEELTIDYSTTEADTLWELAGGAQCRCGARNCRKVIKSIQFLPKTQFKKYLPFIPTYFKKLYLRSI